MSDWLGLQGKAVLVVGAGGIGAAAAAGFAAQGARVLVADKDPARLAAVEPDLRPDGGTSRADLRDAAACRALVAEAAERLGGLDVLVHCVGINLRQPVLEFGDEQWDELIAVNLTSAFRLGQAVGRRMCAQGSGRIVFLSSVSGLLAHAHHAPYAASKGGINQMMRVMAREWAGAGVTVNAVAPGYTETPLTAEYLGRDGVRQGLEALVPAGRLGRVEDVVDAILFLSSARAAFVTGHVLYVDGGRTLV